MVTVIDMSVHTTQVAQVGASAAALLPDWKMAASFIYTSCSTLPCHYQLSREPAELVSCNQSLHPWFGTASLTL